MVASLPPGHSKTSVEVWFQRRPRRSPTALLGLDLVLDLGLVLVVSVRPDLDSGPEVLRGSDVLRLRSMVPRGNYLVPTVWSTVRWFWGFVRILWWFQKTPKTTRGFQSQSWRNHNHQSQIQDLVQELVLDLVLDLVQDLVLELVQELVLELVQDQVLDQVSLRRLDAS
ncbi:uncharacterized protein V6R79_020036 [Siganus canaliculatus]